MSVMKVRYSDLCQFKEALYQFDSFDSFYLKLMSIFPIVFRDGKKYCFCNEYGPYVCCPLCSIRFYFSNFKEDLKENRITLSTWLNIETICSCFWLPVMWEKNRQFLVLMDIFLKCMILKEIFITIFRCMISVICYNFFIFSYKIKKNVVSIWIWKSVNYWKNKFLMQKK